MGCNRRVNYQLRSVDDQLARVLDGVRPLNPIDVGLTDARGCILAEDVVAPWPLPPFDNSAMDGYAVVAASVANASRANPIRLKVIDDVPAGSRPRATIGPGVAARIMTGAPLPDGADAVVMDVRGITQARRGCEFELQQLAQRLPAQRLVLVVDGATDKAVLQAAFGPRLDEVRLVEVRRSREADRAFSALVDAAN